MKKWVGGLFAVALTAGLLFLYFSPQITGANHLAYGIWGDGYKNYYTLAYYLKYNSGSHFTGMNYPFGENVIFTDNQPLVAWVMKAVYSFFPGIAGYIHAYIAYAFFLSLLISAYLIYKIFIELEVDTSNAALFSTAITMLSPQMPRLSGHFALSYSFFIPAMLYLLVRFLKSHGALKYFTCLLLLTSLSVFIHIYYAAMMGMFILLVAVVCLAADYRNISGRFRIPVLLVIAASFPFVLLKSYLFLTDHITDRPSAPWGYLESRSRIFDIFLHPYTFTGEFLRHQFPQIPIEYSGEGGGYIGLVTLISLLAGGVIFLFSKKTRSEIFSKFYPFNLFIIPAICVLLFAMAFPFYKTPFAIYYSKLPGAIKQFRASGRFNWIFYYNATILGFALLYRFYLILMAKKKWMAWSLLAVAYTIWFIEINMISNHQEVDFKNYSADYDETKAASGFSAGLQKSGKQAGDFQAILPLPFFLNGSEKIYIESTVAYNAMRVSLFTGLPITACQASRTSLAQTLKLADLLSDPLIKKEILKEFNNSKPLLMMISEGALSVNETALSKMGTFLFSDQNCRYYQLDLTAFKDSVAETKKYFSEQKSRFINHGDYLSNESTDNVFTKRFEAEPKDYAVFGKGAHYSDEGTTLLFDTLPNASDSTVYNVSYWVYSDKRIAAYPVIYLSEYDSTGKEINKFDSNAKFSTNTYGKWVRAGFDFMLYEKKNKIYMNQIGKYATIDEVMIRPQNVNVITQFENDSTFIFNNYPIR